MKNSIEESIHEAVKTKKYQELKILLNENKTVDLNKTINDDHLLDLAIFDYKDFCTFLVLLNAGAKLEKTECFSREVCRAIKHRSFYALEIFFKGLKLNLPLLEQNMYIQDVFSSSFDSLLTQSESYFYYLAEGINHTLNSAPESFEYVKDILSKNPLPSLVVIHYLMENNTKMHLKKDLIYRIPDSLASFGDLVIGNVHIIISLLANGAYMGEKNLAKQSLLLMGLNKKSKDYVKMALILGADFEEKISGSIMKQFVSKKYFLDNPDFINLLVGGSTLFWKINKYDERFRHLLQKESENILKYQIKVFLPKHLAEIICDYSRFIPEDNNTEAPSHAHLNSFKQFKLEDIKSRILSLDNSGPFTKDMIFLIELISKSSIWSMSLTLEILHQYLSDIIYYIPKKFFLADMGLLKVMEEIFNEESLAPFSEFKKNDISTLCLIKGIKNLLCYEPIDRLFKMKSVNIDLNRYEEKWHCLLQSFLKICLPSFDMKFILLTLEYVKEKYQDLQGIKDGFFRFFLNEFESCSVSFDQGSHVKGDDLQSFYSTIIQWLKIIFENPVWDVDMIKFTAMVHIDDFKKSYPKAVIKETSLYSPFNQLLSALFKPSEKDLILETLSDAPEVTLPAISLC